MEFLESLYSIPNFGIYLFVVIGILVVLFLVILFFGKKDEQKRKLEKKEEEVAPVLEQPSVDMAFQEISAPVQVEIPEVPPMNVSNDFVSEAPSSLEMEAPVSSDFQQEKDFDFDALAEAISKELESIENNEVKVPYKEEVPVAPVSFEPVTPVLEKVSEPTLNYQVFEPVVEEVKPVAPSPVKVEPVVPVKPEEPVVPKVEVEAPKVTRPAVFSSVYVNRDKEEPILTEAQKQPAQEEIVKPVAPKIELPKMMDLPKMK